MAGSGRRVFSPGEVLTASNTMNYLMDQTVMSFAGTAARGSAIGTAVAEGMVSYLQDTNNVQVYDGSAWNSLAYASSVVSPGIVPIAIPISSVSIAGGTATANNGIITIGAGTTSVSFNSVMPTTYDRYKIIYRLQFSANGNQGYFKHRAGTTDYTINYFGGGFQSVYTGNLTAQVAINNGSFGWIGTGATNVNSLQGEIDIKPVAGTTSYNFYGYSTHVSGVQGGGYESPSATRTDGFTIYPSGGSFQGTIQLLAYVK